MMSDKLNKIFNIKNKRVLITGTAGYFGKYISKAFLEVGAKVILVSRSDRLLGQIEEYKSEFGEEAVAGFQVDFYNRNEIDKVLHRAVNEFDIDVLINNAYDFSEKTGFNTSKGNLESSTYDQWHSAFESGIYWAVQTTRIVGEQFRAKRKGNIINISSMYGLVSPNPKLYEGKDFFNPPTYGVVKAGIIALTKYTASFWGNSGIRCNAVAPGAFPNVESKSANSVNNDNQFLERLINNTVLNRVGHPNDLIGTLIYLASDASGYITGQTIQVDGGWTIT